MLYDRFDAPFVFDQPINGASFTRWVEQQLCQTMGPGDLVILDNLSSHKKPSVRAAIRARGAKLLFLPPYSPDLNPIEQVFAKLKHLMRKAAERIHEATRRRIGSLLETRSEEHTSELQSLMRISYAVFCLKKKKNTHRQQQIENSRTIVTITQTKTM